MTEKHSIIERTRAGAQTIERQARVDSAKGNVRAGLQVCEEEEKSFGNGAESGTRDWAPSVCDWLKRLIH